MFLSIIIPVYNAIKTIDRCLDSIWSQGLPEDDYEVICVDDCSTDDSYKHLLSIAKEHPQLKVIKNNINLRAGGARNYGVREAKGEYILFIDSDDLFYQASVKYSYDFQKSNAIDILMLDFSRQYSIKENSNTTLNYTNRNQLSGKEFIKINGCPYGPCKFIFKRQLMIDNNIWFCEKCCCEDVDWCHRLVLSANSIIYQPIILSIVIINESSQTAIEHKSIKTIGDKIYAGKRLLDIAEKFGNDNTIKKHLLNVAKQYISQGCLYMTACNAPIKIKSAILSRNSFKSLHTPPYYVKFAINNAVIFSILTNISALFIPYIIYFKRRLFKR